MTSKKQAAPYASYIHEYYAKIISGEIVVGAWILAVYKIIVAGLAAGEYFYDGKRANKAIRFIPGNESALSVHCQ